MMEFTHIFTVLALATGLCYGGKIQPRIDATPGQHPYQAIIEDIAFATPYYRCGASILDKDHILTAAHCVVTETSIEDTIPFLRVIVGDHDLDIIEGTEQISAVSGIIPHPDYNPDTKENDIAIISLVTDIAFNSEVIPVNLYYEGIGGPEILGDECVVSGWGVTYEDGFYPNILQNFDVDLVADEDCASAYGYAALPEPMICATAPDERLDACSRMAGAPLTCTSTSGNTYIVGVASGAFGCTVPDYPTIYTEVADFIDWIDTELCA